MTGNMTGTDKQKKKKRLQKFMMLFVIIIMVAGYKKTVHAGAVYFAIGGTEVNSDVASSGKGSSGGTWSYKPENGIEKATLTLNNYNGGIIDYIYATSDLNIVLIGNNVIANVIPESNNHEYAINYSPIDCNDLTIKGTGKLNINSKGYGIYCEEFNYHENDAAYFFLDADLTITCKGLGIDSYGKCCINSGNLTIQGLMASIASSHIIQNGGNINLTTTGFYSGQAIFVEGAKGRFEANGGTLKIKSNVQQLYSPKGDFYFNEGCHVEAVSGNFETHSLETMEGQIHFNGGEVKLDNGFYSCKDEKGKSVYFGDKNPNRKMAYFAGSHMNSLTRVNSFKMKTGLDVEWSENKAIFISPMWNVTVNAASKDATIKLTNKTPNFGSGPATTVAGMKGETISVSASCTKGKKIASLYYYKKSDPTKKTDINLTTKTFTMPDYDIVVVAKVIKTAKVSSVKFNKTKVTIQKGKSYTLRTSIKPANVADHTLTWKSSNKKVAAVSQSGVVTGKKYGTATITATAKDGSGKKATCKVSVGYKIEYKLNGGTNNKSNPSAYYKQKITLKDPVRAGYIFKGWYTNKKMTKKIKVISKQSKKNYTLYAKWQKIKAPSAPKISKVVNVTGSKIELKFKKMKNVDGYEISYATNTIFTKNVKTTTTTKATTTLIQMKNGMTYYIRVRAYKLDSAKKKVYGAYSQVERVEVKK